MHDVPRGIGLVVGVTWMDTYRVTHACKSYLGKSLIPYEDHDGTLRYRTLCLVRTDLSAGDVRTSGAIVTCIECLGFTW